MTRGKVLSTKSVKEEKTEDYQFPVYSSKTKDNGLLGYYDQFLFEDAVTWTTDGAYVGTVKYRKGKFFCTNVCGVLLSAEGYANQCVSERLNLSTKEYVAYTGNPKLMNDVMEEIEIPLPTLPEQQKIGSLFAKLDHLIHLQEKRLKLLQDLKKGLLQSVFPKNGEAVPELRFKEFTGKWETKKLGDAAPLRGGYAFKSEQYIKEGIPVIRISNILTNGSVGGEFVYYATQNNDDSFLLKDGSTLLAMSGATTGKIAIFLLEAVVKRGKASKVCP